MSTIKPYLVFLALVTIVFSNLPQSPGDVNKKPTIDHKEVKRYDKPSEAAAWLASMRQTPKGTTPAQLNLAHTANLKIQKSQKTNQDLPALQFIEKGPGIFGGRIRAFAIHPDREGHLLAGGVSGGVWKSTDDGLSWQAKTDFLASIAIGSMLIDPDNPEKVYVGTGEGFFNFDAAQGYGIFYSEDFGETWQRFGITNREEFYYVNRMVKIPGSSKLLAATQAGIFRTTNEGNTWQEVSNFTTNGRGFTDLKIDPSNNNHLLAYHFGANNVAILDLNISSPASVVGNYNVVPATFGPDLTSQGLEGEILLVDDSVGSQRDGCEEITNDIDGKIALIERGSCNFTVKVINAQNAGAIGVIVFQNLFDEAFPMGGDDPEINIPSGMITKQLGDRIRTGIPPVLVTLKNTGQVELNNFVMRSTNGGDFWSTLNDHGLPELDVERMEIGFGQDGRSYIAVSKFTEEFDNNTTNGTMGLYKSTATGISDYTKTASNTNFIERQGWYDLAVAVDPNDSQHVVMGAVEMFATTDGGNTITQSSKWDPRSGDSYRYIHADHHGYFFSPHNNEHIYIISDGGVAKSEDGGDSFFSLNNGLNISQSYGIAVSPDGTRITSGTQDNGSQLYFGDQQAWLEWNGGDGGFSAWDQQQGQYVYGSYVEGELYGSSNGGNNVQSMTLPDTDGARFIQPFVLDENDGNRMLVGTDNLFFTNNARFLGNASWQDVSGTIDSRVGLSAVAFNPHVSTQAFAGTAGTRDLIITKIVKITGLGTSNQVTDISPSNAFNTGESAVTDIKVDLFDTSGNTIYATFADYKADRILRSTDGGSNWTSIAGNLPDIPLYQVTNDPDDQEVLYVGSELGLWVGKKSADNYQWTQFDYGPAYTRIIDLVWNNGSLFVGTHGRGTYQATKQPINLSLIKFIGTDSSCDVDNILDRGESGQLLISVANHSAKNFDEISIAFNEPNFLSLTQANQSFALNGFSQKTIALNTTLDSQSSCLADITIPATISTSEGSYETEVVVSTAANVVQQKGTYSDNAEGVELPMISQLSLGSDHWIVVDDNVNSGSNSWFTTNESSYSDKSLTSPWMVFDGGGNQLSFALSYDTEGDSTQRWDGMVLEMQIFGDEQWLDIGHLSSVPYDGQLSTNNTIQARFAWSGSQLDWRQAVVDLGTQFIGQKTRFRFRMISNEKFSFDGVWLDDIAITNVIITQELTCDTCISSANKVPNKGLWYDPAHDGHGFIIEAVGADDLFYTMFYTYDDNGNPEWMNSLTTLSNGVLNQSFAANTLRRFKYNYGATDTDPVIPDTAVTDGRLSIDFNTSAASNHPACQDGVSRPESLLALATWRINDTTETWCIIPLIGDTARPEPDFGTAWWAGPAENGWGYSLAQTGDRMIAYVFYYDALGNPRWATGSNTGFAPNQDFTIPMLDVFGYPRTATPVPTTLVSSGQVIFNLSNTLKDLDTDGTNSIDVTYQGIEGGRWLRNDIEIMTLLREH